MMRQTHGIAAAVETLCHWFSKKWMCSTVLKYWRGVASPGVPNSAETQTLSERHHDVSVGFLPCWSLHSSENLYIERFLGDEKWDGQSDIYGVNSSLEYDPSASTGWTRICKVSKLDIVDAVVHLEGALRKSAFHLFMITSLHFWFVTCLSIPVFPYVTFSIGAPRSRERVVRRSKRNSSTQGVCLDKVVFLPVTAISATDKKNRELPFSLLSISTLFGRVGKAFPLFISSHSWTFVRRVPS